MTLRHSRSSTDSTQTRPRTTPRLRLKPKGSTAGHVDGAWWPHSDDLPIELPDLLAVLSIRLGRIDRVTYNFTDWASAPYKFPTGEDMVALRGYYQQPGNTVQIVGINRTKLVLLVVPTRTDAEHAHDIMMSAAAPDNASSIEALLHD
ncbi:hypothetical protein A5658_06860 [Mycobacterium sp. 1245111.1]|uniref:DUF5994 family protein n=1 Tax=Mycobacterium sp. 1245111.1 TaxID=1834073 RepID=UPI0007FEFB3D|nr:DUF5994 family protein [Mycobacterium sp. 1245111.1]OBK36105.1 hypothetical protein A5658_06860 [Mycobacterium sp. 1245111.1]